MTGANQAGAEAAHPANLITVAADRYGARPAFTTVLPDGSAQDANFAEADRLSDAFAGFLIEELVLSPGDVIAVQLANGLFFPIAVFGAWKAGLIVTPINPFYTAVETRRQLVGSGARALFASHGSAITDGTALTALPPHHIFAFLFGILVYVDAGVRNVIVPSARPVANLRPAFENHAINWMAGAVIGVSNGRTGEAVRAYVVLREPRPTPEELDGHCRRSLAAYKVPRDFVVIGQLPKSAVGKVLRAALRRL